MKQAKQRFDRKQAAPAAAAERNCHGRAGFTLLEMLVALMILSMSMAIVWQTFSVSIKAWRKGENFLSEMHHGDFVMEQLTEALRSAAYFDQSGGIYGFRLENREEGKYPNDILSWVKSGTAFMPPDAKLGSGLHRVDFTVDNNDDGDAAVMARIYPHLADQDEDDFAAGETWEISEVVKGIDCRVYVEEDEEWSEEWEETNSIPALMELTLYMDPLEGEDKPVTVKRAVQIPISRELKSGVIFDEGGKTAGGTSDEEAAAAARRAAAGEGRPDGGRSQPGGGARTAPRRPGGGDNARRPPRDNRGGGRRERPSPPRSNPRPPSNLRVPPR